MRYREVRSPIIGRVSGWQENHNRLSLARATGPNGVDLSYLARVTVSGSSSRRTSTVVSTKRSTVQRRVVSNMRQLLRAEPVCDDTVSASVPAPAPMVKDELQAPRRPRRKHVAGTAPYSSTLTGAASRVLHLPELYQPSAGTQEGTSVAWLWCTHSP